VVARKAPAKVLAAPAKPQTALPKVPVKTLATLKPPKKAVARKA
jgi:hypothetical protein